MCFSCRDNTSLSYVDASNGGLKLENGVLFYHKKPYTGHLVSKYLDESPKSDIEYKDGRKIGFERHWYSDGRLSEERHYTKGIKTGIHKSWWKDGRPKFEYHFNEKGEFHGVVKEWYKSGRLYRYFNYTRGQEDGPQHLWKSDGTIKANYHVVHGERFGLIGLKKCYTVKGGQDELN
ncbi:toxin-antitoxin system YwqK family antitoxin [Aestuariivivens sediminis]|uniref:toxin-antitoxin system YwqK family antitoxin n=1 Tax=Aestuariivivens sediminis TaxID=2913557 RepID=UPI001F574B35|nr:hypothetical protein [Aestuariivivens sediminis]